MGHVDKAATTLSNLSTRSEHKAETKAADDERKGDPPEEQTVEAKSVDTKADALTSWDEDSIGSKAAPRPAAATVAARRHLYR